MKPKIPVLTIIFLAVFAVQSCYTPAKLVKLTPGKEADKWFYGQALMHDSVYGVDYEIGFDKFVNKQYIFDFHITNHSNMPILIDPVDFYYIPYDSLMNPMTPAKVHAKDPEEEILELEKHLSRDEARSKNRFGMALAAFGADVATSIIVASDDRPNNDIVQRAVADGVHLGIAASGAANEDEIIDLNILREKWENSSIRKTTLETNQEMHGKVFFPASPEASVIQILVPVDDQWLEFNFKQTLVPAKE